MTEALSQTEESRPRGSQELALDALSDAIRRHDETVAAGHSGLATWHEACRTTALQVETAYQAWRATWADGGGQ